MLNPHYSETVAKVKASSPIRTSLYEREGSMEGCLKRPSPRKNTQIYELLIQIAHRATDQKAR